MTPLGRQSGTQGQLVVDVKDVSADSRVGDLTVAQFVEVVAQVVAQVPVLVRPQGTATQEKILEAIKASIEDSSPDSPVGMAVRGAQLAIIDQMPALLREAQLLDDVASSSRRET